jgi:hypothetical protein
MDYDDLVDQFIVNDHETNTETEKAEEIKTESATSKTNSDINLELIKLHMKNLIQARQQSRQIIQLNWVKERNKNFAGVFKAANSGSGNSFGNSEKRRKVLAGDKDKASAEVTIDTKGETNEAENFNEEQDRTAPALASTELIPCRLELDYEGYKLSDVFLLPSNPPPNQIFLDSMACQLCQDFDLPVDLFQPAISKCLKDQVEEWHVYQGALEGMKLLPYEEIGAVPVRLDVIVGLHRLEDQLEVSLDPKDSNTETMIQFVKNLKSPDETILPESGYAAFRPLILHNLLEQLMLWRKAIVFGGYHRDPRSNNLKFHDGDVAVLLNDPPSNKSGVIGVRRHFADTNSFTPILSLLTVEELDKIEAGRERESRRRRRTVVTSTSNSNTSKKSSSAMIVNNLTGTVRSPPRTLPTPTSYRGGQHRIQQTAVGSDDETSAPRKRGRKAKY